MRDRALLYGLVGLLAVVTPIGLLSVSRSVGANGAAIDRDASANGKNDARYPRNSPALSPGGTGMMGGGQMMGDQQQIDRHFIQMMIPHHQGAIDMAKLASRKAKHPEIKELARAIETDQSREIQEMRAWYQKWYGTDVPSVSHTGMSMHEGMSGNAGLDTDMTWMMGGMGMMNLDLDALENAPDFDRAFLEGMIYHHEMAIMMAAMVLNSPRAELRDLGKAIIANQTAEIDRMVTWQETWFR
ncbi:DUF305 domain-containing protein [Pannus brasiliensis CCIBt3594]|uniref:DUF305 domain-containing protein n=1 Tax=Pannus brasiliensis CCIBt3594 TaxID=1427578 RepID=A0AAW9QHK0_9CHRO